jgi:hypothetical protein
MSLARSAASGWRPAYPVSGPTNINGGAALGIDRAGNAVAAWSSMSCSGRSSCLAASVLPVGQTRWKTPQVISVSDFGYRPTVGTDPRGQPLVVWVEMSEKSGWSIRATRYVRGRWLQSRTLRRLPEGNRAELLQLATNEAGNGALVWASRRPPGDGRSPMFIEAAVRLRSGRWLSTQRLSQRGGGAGPSVAVDPAGNAVAVWQRLVGPPVVESASLGAGRRVWSRTRVLGTGSFPSVAVDGHGNFFAAWRGNSGVDIAVRRAGTRSWQRPRTVASSQATYPRLAVGRGGAAALVWERFEPALASSIEATRLSSPAGNWERPRILSRAPALNPEAAVDSRGNLFVAWEYWGRSGGGSSSIEAIVRPAAASAWPAPDEVSPNNGTRRIVSQVVARGNRRALVAWSSWQAGVEVAAFDGR